MAPKFRPAPKPPERNTFSRAEMDAPAVPKYVPSVRTKRRRETPYVGPCPDQPFPTTMAMPKPSAAATAPKATRGH